MTLLMQANHMFPSCIGAGVLSRLTVLFSVLLFCHTIHAEVIGKPFVQLGHIRHSINSVAFSPDGHYFLSGSGDKSIKLWDVASGKEIRTYSGHDNSVNAVVFSPDGRLFLSGSNTSMRLWDVSSGEMIYQFSVDWIKSILFSADSQSLLSGLGGETISVTQWDANTGKERVTVSGNSKFSTPLVFSPDGEYVISAPDPELFSVIEQGQRVLTSGGATMTLVEVATGREVRRFTGHTDYILSAAFTPDGHFLASSGNDMTLRLWSVSTGEEIRKFSDQTNLTDAMGYAFDLLSMELESEMGHSVEMMEEEIRYKHSVYTLDFSPDGQYLVSASNKGVRLWEVFSGKMIREFSGHSDRVNSVKFSPDGRFILAGSEDSSLKLWKVYNGKEVREYSGDSDLLSSLSFSPDGQQLISGSWDKSLRLWDITTSRMTRKFTGHSGAVSSVSFSPDGNYVLSASSDMSMRLWNAENAKQTRQFSVSGPDVSSVAFSPDGRYALSSGSAGTSIWDISSGAESQHFSNHTPYMVSSSSFSSDGKYLVSRHYDKSLRLWSLTSGKEVRKYSGYAEGVRYTFSPDGRYLIQTDLKFTGEKIEKPFSLLALSTGEEIRQFSASELDIPVVFSSDSGQLLSAHADGKFMKLWDVSSGEEIARFPDHLRVGYQVVFSPDGHLIASAYSDGSFKLFDAIRFEELASYYGFSDGEWIVITPDGYFNASPYGAEHINVLTSPMRVAGIDQYYETFYRPGIVNAAIQGNRIDTGLRLADVKPAPLIEIINTPNETSDPSVGVTLKLIDQGGGIGDIRIFLNGTAILADNGRGLKVDKSSDKAIYKNFSLRLLNGKNEIKAIAYNAENSMNSRDARKTIMAEILSAKPDLHALVIGIDEFKNSGLNLNYAASDARLFSETLKKHSSSLFENIHVTLLTTSEQTGKVQIIGEFERAQKLDPDDLFVLFVASHGMLDAGNYYLITSNVGSLSTKRLKQDAMSQDDLKRLIANIPTQKKLIILDTCGSQALGDSLQVAMMTRGLSEYTAMKVLSRAIGSTILSASTATQDALEGYQDHGLFSYVVSEGLAGKADANGDGFIKTTELADYVDDVVPEIAEKEFNRAQYPAVSPGGQAFPITEVR